MMGFHRLRELPQFAIRHYWGGYCLEPLFMRVWRVICGKCKTYQRTDDRWTDADFDRDDWMTKLLDYVGNESIVHEAPSRELTQNETAFCRIATAITQNYHADSRECAPYLPTQVLMAAATVLCYFQEMGPPATLDYCRAGLVPYCDTRVIESAKANVPVGELLPSPFHELLSQQLHSNSPHYMHIAMHFENQSEITPLTVEDLDPPNYDDIVGVGQRRPSTDEDLTFFQNAETDIIANRFQDPDISEDPPGPILE